VIGEEEISMFPIIEYALQGHNVVFCEDQAGIETINFAEHEDVLKRLEMALDGWNELGSTEDHKVTR